MEWYSPAIALLPAYSNILCHGSLDEVSDVDVQVKKKTFPGSLHGNEGLGVPGRRMCKVKCRVPIAVFCSEKENISTLFKRDSIKATSLQKLCRATADWNKLRGLKPRTQTRRSSTYIEMFTEMQLKSDGTWLW